ncbi:hypothetical protein ACSMAE_001170, partial [Cronobacter sakazakii]
MKMFHGVWGWNCIKENCGGIFELQQNKSGGFSPASGGEGQTSCRRVAARYRCGTICRSAPGLLCPQTLTVADRHTKKPHASHEAFSF